MEVVGVCNGVLCLCDDAKPGGAITLANPATGDVLVLPPVPCHGLFGRHNTRRSARSWHQAYSFGFHQATGQYKVVHVPCFFKTKDAVQVFTLGESSWREVQAPAYARCNLDTGVVSVDGSTYWVTEGSEDRIMCFDLESEQVTCTDPLPMAARPISHLTQVDRKLATATTTHTSYTSMYNSTEVILNTLADLLWSAKNSPSYLQIVVIGVGSRGQEEQAGMDPSIQLWLLSLVWVILDSRRLRPSRWGR
jgi:F-box interacting protein